MAQHQWQGVKALHKWREKQDAVIHLMEGREASCGNRYASHLSGDIEKVDCKRCREFYNLSGRGIVDVSKK